MAGLIPGIILTILFSLTIYTWVSLRPSAAPLTGDSFSLKEKLVSIKGPVPILIIFLGMLWGIFTRFFSPSEAAGIGVFYVLAMVLITRRLTWQRFKSGTGEALRITAFIMVLIMGAMLFAHTIALSHLPALVADLVLGLEISPLVLMFAIIGVFIVFGMFLDVFGLMVLFVPTFFPTVISLGYDIVWYGTLSVLLIEMACITPPMAGHIYIAQSVDPESTSTDVMRGVIPFYLCVLILIMLLVFFPQIALWLPSMM